MIPNTKSEAFNLGAWIEKYRLPIGISLFVAVIFSGGYLFYRENYQKTGDADRIATLESRISELETIKAEANISGNIVSQATSSPNETVSTASIASSQETGSVKGASTTTAKTEMTVTGMVNINTASLSQLDSLSGIGPTYAQRIIDYRESHGGFKTIDEIKEVKGIGDKTFEKFKDKITVQ